MIKWMWDQNKAMVYPNLDGRLQFCTNHVGEQGTNQRPKARNVMALPLVSGDPELSASDSLSQHLKLEGLKSGQPIGLRDLSYYNAQHLKENTTVHVLQHGKDLLHIFPTLTRPLVKQKIKSYFWRSPKKLDFVLEEFKGR